jgi:hypothetical protein
VSAEREVSCPPNGRSWCPLTLISAATQIQRWRDFLSHVAAYVLSNLLLIGIWAVTGRLRRSRESGQARSLKVLTS